MKRTKVLFLTAVLVLTISGLALAQMDKGKDTMGDKGMGMMGKGMMNSKMMGMCPMMQSMMQKQVVATSDGGIIVVAGNKLTKYDKDLNVIKEVELKMDTEGMQKMMDNMKSMCPMMGKGMMGDMKEDSKGNESTSTDEHSSHHPDNK
ncbi:MAG: hypothetical protein KBD53_11450 [Candidatus Omnitrophica bacterium]|nr:hypothetical protein [Candidatus Omnitrophota bacterium]